MAAVIALSGRERAKAFRERQRAGVVVLQIEVNEIDLVSRLIDARLLDPNEADDREAIEAAAQRVLQIFTEN